MKSSSKCQIYYNNKFMEENMDKKELIKKIENNEPIKAIIYVAANYKNEEGKKTLASQRDICMNFADEHSNIEIVDIFEDSSVAVQSFSARGTYFKFRGAIDSREVDLVIVASLKQAACRVSNFVCLLHIFDNNDDTCLIDVKKSSRKQLHLIDSNDLQHMEKNKEKFIVKLGLIDALLKEKRNHFF